MCGMGTPDMLGGYGTYQYFAEDVPAAGVEEQGGKPVNIAFDRIKAVKDLWKDDNPVK